MDPTFDFKAENLDMEAGLLWAATNGHCEGLKFLLERGADISVRVLRSGFTALHLAAHCSQADVIPLLLKHGFNIDEKCLEYSRTSLHLTAKRGLIGMVYLLIEKGARIEERDEFGDSALAVAATSGMLGVVKVLIEKGANLEARDNHGSTGVHKAARAGHEKVVQLLIKKGANVHAKDINGWTPLHKSASKGHPQVVSILLEEGANVHDKEIGGRTALMIATEYGQQSVVQVLLEIAQREFKTENTSFLRTIPNDYSQYTALDQKKDEIRLLRIEAFPGESKLTCSIVRTSLQDHPPFTALSYCWGSLDNTVPISICFDDYQIFDSSCFYNRSRRTQEFGHVFTDFNITTNLYDALYSFQRHDNDIFIWNDMLCINQGNMLERSQQVAIMSRIYTAAETVIVWLGGDPDANSDILFLDESEDLDIFIKLLQKLSSPEDTELSEQWASMCSNFLENDEYHDSFNWNEMLDQIFDIPYKSVATNLYLMYTSMPEEVTELIRTRKSKGVAGVDSYFYDVVLNQNSLVLRLATFLSLDHEMEFNEKQEASWEGLLNVLRRWHTIFFSPWFSRIWVIQEIVNSKKACVRHGKVQVDWNMLLNYHLIYKALNSAWSSTAHTTRRQEMILLIPQFIPYLQETGTFWYSLWEKIDSLKQRKLSFTEILFAANDFLSTDIRDKIYAIAPLASDIEVEELVPDYFQPPAAVFSSFTSWFFQNKKSLELLSFCRHSHQSESLPDKIFRRLEGLPTWCPDYRDIPMFRFNSWRYNADGSRPARVLRGDNPMSLHVEGVSIARVSKVMGMEPEILWAQIWSELKSRGFLPDKPKKSSTTDKLDVLRKSSMNLERYFSTLAANFIDPERLGVFAQMVLDTEAVFDFELSWSENHFLQKYNTGAYEMSKLKNLFDVQTAVTRDKSLFISHDGRFGLGPMGIESGDIVAVLSGSSVPFILREKKLHSKAPLKDLSKWLQEGTVYQFMGECYLDGRMEGEIFEDARFDDPLNIDPLDHDYLVYPGDKGGWNGERISKGVYRRKFFHLR